MQLAGEKSANLEYQETGSYSADQYYLPSKSESANPMDRDWIGIRDKRTFIIVRNVTILINVI